MTSTTLQQKNLTKEQEPLLVAENLKVHFPLKKDHILAKPRVVHAVDDISLSIPKGSIFGVVGESGSGKTTLALSLVRLNKITGGKSVFMGKDITHIEGEELREMRQHMQVVFQDPYSSLNPRLRAGEIVREPMERMNITPPEGRQARVESLFESVGLRKEQMALFPHQFSGGQRQRIGVARALASEPKLLVLDEPVSALDVAIQAQLLNLFKDVQKRLGLTYLFISHDLGVVNYLCDHIAVMYLGKLMEVAPRAMFFKSPRHPYSQMLLAAVPKIKGGFTTTATEDNSTEKPTAIDPGPGCRFASRCPLVQAICQEKAPEMREIETGHKVACHHYC